MNFKNLLSEYKEYSDLLTALKKGDTPISVSGIVDSAWGQFIYETSDAKRTLVLAHNDREAERIAENLRLFCDRIFLFPKKEYVFFDIDAQDRNIENARLTALYEISKGGILVASIDSILTFTLPYEKLEKYTVTLKLGDSYDRDELIEKLIKMGYSREEEVSGKGQFAVRGGILDIFSPQAESPVRVEFFDIEVDSVREFDIETQRSTENIKEAVIIPCSELADLEKDELCDKLSGIIKKLNRKKKDTKEITEHIQNDIDSIKGGVIPKSVCKYLGVIFDEIPTVSDYFGKDDMIILTEPKRVMEQARGLEFDFSETLKDLTEKNLYTKEMGRLWGDYGELSKVFGERRLISLNTLSHSSVNYTYKAIFNFNTKTTVSLHGRVEYLYDDLEKSRGTDKTTVILAGSRSRGENLAGTLSEKGINCRYIEGAADFEKGETVIIKGDLSKGFEYPDINFTLISEQEIFDGFSKRSKRKSDSKNRIKSYTDINVGDYVVHKTHGIGRYMGIKKITVSGVTKDYLHIAYRGTDSLYVPATGLEMLYKYSGASDAELRLNKLGGAEWDKTKQRVKKATRDMAKQLTELYANREYSKGYAFSPDTVWQREFEDTFPYQETEDQIRSIEEVKRDMQSDKPMERLLCGDVGYGKTEVAIRAAFKAATDSKQVAYLCPTTILAMQQYETFVSRMKDFPIKIEMLSRFRTASEQAKILKKLKSGEIDIVIGTHRLLQKDVAFKDLGLLIIDEEQRFGVAHKEQLKELKKNVDVLSMSATPIPRTLHMAMVSVRDMSLLETPPENRYPVTTYVLEFNDEVILNAIKKELQRGGQVFYLFNRVKGIYRVAEWLKTQLPDAKVAVGHGKMKEDELEDIMYDMVNGKTDILVCTTIIETGLDIPNANTIIVENADRMGLSQLYQLRGRVGRSDRNAYAYFTYRRDELLTETAERRLSAIKEFTEFGSGFKIAMRDLEIRGAGDILGAEQHGHIDSVGYDMYCKILENSIREMQGLPEKHETETGIDLNIDAYIPERYIKSTNIRIDAYKRIAVIENDDDASDVTDELIDRFGEMPKAVRNLIEIAIIKALANNIGITEISQQGANVLFKFEKDRIEDGFLELIMDKYFDECTINPKRPVITYRQKEPQKMLSNIKFLLQQLNELHSTEK
ncbi:MAG: transcription-repair coupling factor [Clostridia bacterium]|nr:transcription-repair coupling factor [Clostridia bacterium]